MNLNQWHNTEFYKEDWKKILEKIILLNYDSKISNLELEYKILTFLPIIIFENLYSLIIRKTNLYKEEVERNLKFINNIYEKI